MEESKSNHGVFYHLMPIGNGEESKSNHGVFYHLMPIGNGEESKSNHGVFYHLMPIGNGEESKSNHGVFYHLMPIGNGEESKWGPGKVGGVAWIAGPRGGLGERWANGDCLQGWHLKANLEWAVQGKLSKSFLASLFKAHNSFSWIAIVVFLTFTVRRVPKMAHWLVIILLF